MYADARHYRQAPPIRAISLSLLLHVLVGVALLVFYVPGVKSVAARQVPIHVTLLSHAPVAARALPQKSVVIKAEQQPASVQKTETVMTRQTANTPLTAAVLAEPVLTTAAANVAQAVAPETILSAPTSTALARPTAPVNAVAGPTDTFTPAQADAAYLDNPRPEYPALAKRRHQEGTVKLEVRVSAQGLPLSVRLYQSSNVAVLDDAALAAVNGWRFVPAHRGAEDVEDTLIVPVRFKLTG